MTFGIEAGCLMGTQYLPVEFMSMLKQETAYTCVLVLSPCTEPSIRQPAFMPKERE